MKPNSYGAVVLVLVLGACSTEPKQTNDADATASVGTRVAPAVPAIRTTGIPKLADAAGDRVFFDTDRWSVTPEGERVLQQQASWLKSYPNATLAIEGHADERGTREYNLALGDRRAESVRTYLVALGVAPQRMRTVSFGKERPDAVGSNETAWSQNRRAVSVVD
jgi:peptidoglycan-associated lipoprotein